MQLFTHKVLAFFAVIAVGTAFYAQAQHAPHTGCGVGLEDGALIKARMMRQRVAAQQAGAPRQANALPTYIPVAVTSVSNTSGQGHANPSDVLAMMCDLNADYNDQNVYFFLKDSIRYRQNNNLYNDASTFNSALYMAQNKVPNALNIYISPTVQNSVASFYSPAGDYVFIITSVANGVSNTATHEVGHFFTLPHTFYGWEGISYHDLYQNINAPNSVGGETVERVARTGTGNNCATAADGFCDTPADFISDRWPCPYVGVQGVLAKDPAGVDINPSEENYMSYYFDACVTTFTAEQKAAMLADLQSRGWSNLAIPTPNNVLDGADIVATAPINNQVMLADGSNTITLQWQALTGATMYQVQLERMLLGQPIGIIFNTLVVGRNSYTFNTSVLPLPPTTGTHDYRWSVKPVNGLRTCANYSGFFTFKTSRTADPVSVATINSIEGLQLQISPNPVENQQVRLMINSEKNTQISLKIYSPDGKICAQQQKENISSGSNVIMVDAFGLAAGLYVVVLTDEKGANLVSRFTVR
jgi:hypothetical protein